MSRVVEFKSTSRFPAVVIRPSRSMFRLGLLDIWKYRELLYFLVWRDLKVRYRQTVFGVLWAILQPLMLMVVFSIFLGHFAGLESEGLPYPLFAFSGLVPWTLFSQALTGASNSVVASANLISKVYFPRLLLPLASAGSYVVDFLIALTFLLLMTLYWRRHLTLSVLWLPMLAALGLVAALAIGIWAAALNVRYRDVRHALPFVVQIWLFLSPVAYASSIVPVRLRPLYAINPMTGVIEGYRWALFNSARPSLQIMAISVGMIFLTLVGGVAYFKTTERTLDDVI